MTEWNASHYHEVSSLQKVIAEGNLARLTLQESEHVLDVGCGDGKITADIAARLPRGAVLGVDPSQDMIAFASSHYDLPNLRFETADVRVLPYRNEFDRVVSFNALHWVPKQDAALRSIREALKPGGRTLLLFVPQGERKSLEDFIEDARRSKQWNRYFAGFRKPYAHFTPQEYRELAERCGWSVESIVVEDKAWDFGSLESFVGFCSVTFVEWTRLVPETERLPFIVDVLERYRVVANNPEEENTFKFYQMEVVLTRS